MAWTAPMTAVANAVFTAAQFNTHVRDNLLETAPAKASTLSGYFCATGTNAIAQRIAARAQTLGVDGNTTATTYSTTLTSGGTNPTVTCTTGERALIAIECEAYHGTANAFTNLSYVTSGATAIVAADDRSILMKHLTTGAGNAQRGTSVHILTSLTPGSNIFTLSYKTSTGTAHFVDRRISVIPF